MKRAILSICLAITALTSASLPARAESRKKVSDFGVAKEWCDDAMLQGLEGIWEFPDDQTRVLVRLLPGDAKYEIVVVDSPDTRLVPGETIGFLQGTPISTKYELSLFRNRQKGILANPGKCLAEINEKEDAMIITGRKLKLSLASRWFLPQMWRSLKVKFNDPLEKIPYGMVRIYPSNKPRKIDYL